MNCSMEESSINKYHNYGLKMKQFYIHFHQFYITNRINNTMEYFVTGYRIKKGTYGKLSL